MIRGITAGLDQARLSRLMEQLGREARARRFDVAPNPCVGAAVLAGASEVARGFHEFWGGPHAEIVALAAAEAAGVPRERWDLLLVTLEPCSSTGKTPPCTDAILRAGIRRVVIGALDPDARHCGKGVELLRAAGIEVYVLDGPARLSDTSPQFLTWTAPERLRRPRPWTLAKWAQTRSGQLSPLEHVGAGRWITGAASLAEVALLRGRVDAVVTGVVTVLADDPRLSVRAPGDLGRAPLRVVLDSYLRTPPDARLLRPAGPDEAAGEVHVLGLTGVSGARAEALREAGANVHGLPAGEGERRVSLRRVQEWLWSRGARRVLLEAGPTLLRAYLDRGFVDQVRIYTGPLNGGRGVSMGDWLAGAHLLHRADRECGLDSVLEAFPRDL